MAAAGLAIAAAAACGASEVSTSAADVTATAPNAVTTTGSGALGTIDWGRPLPATIEVASSGDAESELAFAPLLPGEVGVPAGIQITDPSSSAATEDRLLVYVYDHPTYGVFYVQQAALDLPADEIERGLERRADPESCPEDHECPVQRSLVRLADGRPLLVTLGSHTNTASFVDAEHGVLVSIVGPPDSLTTEEAVAVANALVSR